MSHNQTDPIVIRKMSIQLEEVFHEGGPVAAAPLKKGACIAVIENPFAGRYELEHGALWHVPGGYAMRELLGDSKAIVPSTKKVASLGSQLDIPLTHINASYVRSHFDAITVGLNDAPRRDELLLALVMSTGARIHERVGGLKASEVTGADGLR